MEWPDELYLPSASVPGVTNIEFTAIPYFANANRQPGEMMVWMAETASQAQPLSDLTESRSTRSIPWPLRIEVQLQPEWSGGLLEWRVESPGTLNSSL